MKNFYITLCIFLVTITQAFASTQSIQIEYNKCLKGLISNIAMANCALEYSKASELEILEILRNNQNTTLNFKNNQALWGNYKKSTQKNINSPLENAPGQIYYLFSAQNKYIININRLTILDYVFNIIPCPNYNSETKNDLAEISRLLKQLKNYMTTDEYNELKRNQADWLQYKNHTELMLKAKLSTQQILQIEDVLCSERYSQLFTLLEFLKHR